MSKIESLEESLGLLEHVVCELMVVVSGLLCFVGIRKLNSVLEMYNYDSNVFRLVNRYKL